MDQVLSRHLHRRILGSEAFRRRDANTTRVETRIAESAWEG